MDNTKKTCTKCKTEKDLYDFDFNKIKNKYNSWCKACKMFGQQQTSIERKKKAVELLGGKCSICGYNKTMVALDFHHVDPSQKSYSWIKLKTRSWEQIVAELKKCIVLCKNCHAELHWKDQPYKGNENNKLNDNKKNKSDKIVKSTGQCPVCNEVVFGKTYCSIACSSFDKRKVTRPNIDELRELIEKVITVR